MKSLSAIFCALSLLTLLNIANAKSMCTPMDPAAKAVYEKIYDTNFMGCTLSPGEGMTAMSRMNWMTPVGSPPLVEMDASASPAMSGMSKMKGGSMMMAAVKVAGASVGRPGYLTASPECVASLEPDFIYSVLAKSTSPKVFNAMLEAACESGTVRNLKTSSRSQYPVAEAATEPATEAAQALAETIICLLGSVLGIFFPFFNAALIATLKGIITGLFDILPTPSITARTIETIV